MSQVEMRGVGHGELGVIGGDRWSCAVPGVSAGALSRRAQVWENVGGIHLALGNLRNFPDGSSCETFAPPG